MREAMLFDRATGSRDKSDCISSEIGSQQKVKVKSLKYRMKHKLILFVFCAKVKADAG